MAETLGGEVMRVTEHLCLGNTTCRWKRPCERIDGETAEALEACHPTNRLLSQHICSFNLCSWPFINAGTTSHTGTGQERLKGMIGKTLDAPMHRDARLTNCFSTLAAAQLHLPTLFPSAEAAPRGAGR